MKTAVVITFIILFEAFFGAFVLGLISCSRDRDEESRKLEDAEQAEYIQHWFQTREERRKRKKRDRSECPIQPPAHRAKRRKFRYPHN